MEEQSYNGTRRWTEDTGLRRRTEGRHIMSRLTCTDEEDSWIEIQPDAIITTGLRVAPVPPTSVAGSSQDEYEESESESERVMSSSTEDIDDASTAIGVHVFTPQPNAFSQPTNTYFPTVTHSERLPSNRMITQRAIRQPDHDAALRASLTTLLSCAAAVRPKERERPLPPARSSNQPTTLRLVPESQMSKPPKRRSRESSKERHAKKIRAVKVNDEPMSPTAMTWMISAGVVLVFSAISFSAGYAWGKEVGRLEEINCGNCGQEAIRSTGGLRKLRWSGAQSVSV